MRSLVKLVFLGLISVLFFIFIVYSSLNNILIPNVILLIVLLLYTSIFISYKNIYRDLVILSVPIVTLFGFGIIYQLIHFSNRTDWITDSLRKIVIFANSYFFYRAILFNINFTDIILSPISFNKKANLIIIKNIYIQSIPFLHRLEWYLDTYSYVKNKRISKIELFNKFNLIKCCSIILSLFFIIKDLLELSWLLLNNRTIHFLGVQCEKT